MRTPGALTIITAAAFSMRPRFHVSSPGWLDVFAFERTNKRTAAALHCIYLCILSMLVFCFVFPSYCACIAIIPCWMGR